MKKVVFQTPLRSSDPRPRIEHVLFREHLAVSERRYILQLGYTFGYPASSTRNKIVHLFLESDGDYLIMMDDDQAPTASPLDYIEMDFDILGFAYPSIRISDKNIIPWYPREPKQGEGIAEVDFIGGGCMVIARRVLEHPGMKAAFLEVYDNNGIFTEGEDLSFCRRARENGFKIHCVMDKPLLHIKPAEMLRVWSYINGRSIS